MNMVGHTIDGQQRTTQVAYNAADEGKKPRFQFGCDEIGSMLGTEYGVDRSSACMRLA